MDSTAFRPLTDAEIAALPTIRESADFSYQNGCVYLSIPAFDHHVYKLQGCAFAHLPLTAWLERIRLEHPGHTVFATATNHGDRITSKGTNVEGKDWGAIRDILAAEGTPLGRPTVGNVLDHLAREAIKSDLEMERKASLYRVTANAVTDLIRCGHDSGTKYNEADAAMVQAAADLIATATSREMLKVVELTQKRVSDYSVGARGLVFASWRRVLGMGE
jgi:hypothetical protein